MAASSASSSELNRTTDGSRRYLPTYPTTTTVQCQRAIDETQWLWLWLCLCRWDATNGGESARERAIPRERAQPGFFALSMGAARSVRLVSSSLVAGGRSKLARKTLQGGRQCAWTGRKMFRKQRYPTGRWSTYREHTEPQPAMDDGSWKDATAQRRHRGVYNTTGNDLYARRWMNDANDALHRTVRPGWASSVHVVRTTPTGHITTSGGTLFRSSKVQPATSTRPARDVCTARSHRKHGEQGAVQACRLPNRGPYMNVIRLPRYDGRIATVASIMTPKFKIKTDGKLLPSLLLHNHHHHHRWRECAANRATKRRDPARAR